MAKKFNPYKGMTKKQIEARKKAEAASAQKVLDRVFPDQRQH